MTLLEQIEERCRSADARIAFPEAEDPRIVEAAGEIAQRQIATPVLIGNDESMPAKIPDGVESEIIEDADRLDKFAGLYSEARGTKKGVAAHMVKRPLVYAGMMLVAGLADGCVAGISHTTANVLQSAGLTVGYKEGINAPSSCFLMIVPHLRGDSDTPVVFADCAVAVDPDPGELAEIAVASARTARSFLTTTPRVAMLSFSTDGSAAHEVVDRIQEATRLAKQKLEDGFVEGELQFDAAVNPDVAEKKGVGGGKVAGKANVIIFPDLNAGNICYKAVREFCGVQAIGPVLQGFALPVNDLSRSASVEDVVATTAVTVVQGM
ncbi:MAG: phosphate acyltransferase [Candidatus Brocadiia bacterium]